MTTTQEENELEKLVAEWRDHLRRRQAIHAVDAEELEGHLRDQVAGCAIRRAVRSGGLCDRAEVTSPQNLRALDNGSIQTAYCRSS